MKYIIITLILSILISTTAQADCWQIRDNDNKQDCLARTKNDSSYCWQIKNNDTKQYCLAKVKKDKSYCWQIKENDKRQSCLAEF